MKKGYIRRCQAGAPLRLQIHTDGLRLAAAQSGDLAEKDVCVLRISGVEAGVGQIEVGQHVVRLEIDR